MKVKLPKYKHIIIFHNVIKKQYHTLMKILSSVNGNQNNTFLSKKLNLWSVFLVLDTK